MSDANRKPPMDAAESETLGMRGNSMHGNRETRKLPRRKTRDGPERHFAVRRTCTFSGSRTVP